MLPIGDDDSGRRLTPIVTYVLIALNVLVFLLELNSGDAFIERWAFVPRRFLADPVGDFATIFTSMFMHAGWEHIIGNMLFFWVFGPQIEDVMGSIPFLIFYLLGGITATVAQVWIDPTSTIPNLGASGAIAAVMGAFLVTYPRDKIRTVIFFGRFGRVTFLPAVVMVGLWFLSQLFSEVGALSQVQADSSGVAYMAHIGGFIFGAVTCRLFESRRRRRLQGLEPQLPFNRYEY